MTTVPILLFRDTKYKHQMDEKVKLETNHTPGGMKSDKKNSRNQKNF